MGEWLPIAVALPFTALLLCSGVWANRGYAQFDGLPAHYGIAGKPARMASRRTVVWLLPVTFSLALLAIALFTVVLPREVQNGDPAIGVLVGGIGLLAAQVFELWFTERWARRRD